MINLIEMQGIRKAFCSGLVETHALREFNLSVVEGEFIAVTGPSGAGKSTFLNIAGLLEPYDKGQYLFDGEDVAVLSDRARAKLRNEKIGFIFQNYQLLPELNIYENIEVPLLYRGVSRKARRSLIEEALERVSLDARKEQFPAQLSGGQQQRVAIARALAGKPKLILADEPTGNLDSVMARQVMRLFEDVHAEGGTIIMTTHDADLAKRAQRKIQVIDGQIADFRPFYQSNTASVPEDVIRKDESTHGAS